MKKENVKEIVRQHYAEKALQGQSCSCSSPEASCCSGAGESELMSLGIGYSMDDIKSVPEGANLGLGCGKHGPPPGLGPGLGSCGKGSTGPVAVRIRRGQGGSLCPGSAGEPGRQVEQAVAMWLRRSPCPASGRGQTQEVDDVR